MPITRTFLDWSQPALPAVADHLIAAGHGGDLTDLSEVIVVLPGRRACRRLLELLVARTDSRLKPPQIITEGQFPELLYEPQRPFAGHLVQQLAWGEAVRRLPRPRAEHLLREIPEDNDVDGWMALGQLLWRLHRELAADQLDFGDVLRQGQRVDGFRERLRWEALSAAQQEYLAILDGLNLWDRQTARLVAIDKQECRTDRDVVLVGAVDLNRTTRAMLDQVAARVTALVHAPPELSARFDEHGCLKPEAWKGIEIDIPDPHLRVADGPSEVADELVRVLASFDGRYRADDVTVGLADESLASQLQRRLAQFHVPARWVVGKMLPQTGTLRLLSAAADYLDAEEFEPFAAFLRHPDVGDWLAQLGLDSDWLSECDAYRAEHLQPKLGFWLGSASRFAGLRQVHRQVTALLGGLADRPRPLAEWSDAILQLPLSVFEHRDFDPQALHDRAELDAIEALQAALAEHAELPELLAPVVSGAEAIRLTLAALAGGVVPAMRDDAAIELLGRLELHLDDSPALIVTSFNEGNFPSSVDADLFLPNRLRETLGINDNDRRYARDAYSLSAMLASREQLVLIAARRDRRGDPLLPSRLALACDARTVARRVEEFFSPAATPLPLPMFADVAREADMPAESPTVSAFRRECRGLRVPTPRPLEQPCSRVRVTAFRDYIACPYRFYLRHILKLERLDDAVEEMTPLTFGSLLHQVMSDFGQSDRKDCTDEREIQEVLNQLLEEQTSRAFGRWRLPAVNVQLEQLRARLAAFARWQSRWAGEGWSIRFVEHTVDDEDGMLPVDPQRSLLLSGRIDRIDRHEDNDLWAIFDYKTGEKGKTPDQVHRRKGEWVDLQLPLYRHLARRLCGSGRVHLGYITLPGDSRTAQEQLAEWNDEELHSAHALAVSIGRSILDQVFLPLKEIASGWPSEFAAICQEGVFDRRLPQ